MLADPGLVHAAKLAGAASSCGMAGVIWFVQVVHYPLLARVGREGYSEYQRVHESRTTLVVAPLMLVEVGSAVLLAWLLRGTAQAGLGHLGAALVVLVFASTFLVQVPLHGRLSRGFTAATHRRLVLSNWARTALWTAHAGVSLALLRA